MGKRLSKIYTRTGDAGDTGLGDGNRIPKDDTRIHAIGTVDELNSHIGLLIAEIQLEDPSKTSPINGHLTNLQHQLFDIGGELSIPGHLTIKAENVSSIEQAIDFLNAELPSLDNFILPGGSKLIALFHIARSVCRRAERELITLNRQTSINQESIRFLNRLSDYLFVAARFLAKQLAIDEVLWESDKKGL